MVGTTEQKREAEAKKIYEAIGRYVVAFEHVVHEIREGCLLLMCPNLDDEDNPKAQRLAEVPLHSRAMGAEALMDVFRTLVAETLIRLEADGKKSGKAFPKPERDAIVGVMKQINREYKKLPERRNEIVHATYFIGFGDETTDGFKDPGYYKRRLTGDGLDFVEDPPMSAGDFDARRSACEALKKYISEFVACFVPSDGPRVSRRFEQKDPARGESARWELKA